MKDWKARLQAAAPALRRALQALLAGRLIFTPGPDGYTFEGPDTVEPIIAGVVPQAVKTGTGPFDPLPAPAHPSSAPALAVP